MDAPPDREDSRPFVRVAALLRAAGVNAPQVAAQDLERGFLLLTDLGDTTYLAALNPGNADRLFGDAIEALLKWQLASRDGALPPYDEALLRRECSLFPEWYVARHLAVIGSPARSSRLFPRCSRCSSPAALAQPAVYVHRDYMPRNLMVTDPNPGVTRFPGRGAWPDQLRPGVAVPRCLRELGRGARSRLDGALLGKSEAGAASGRPGFQRVLPAISNGWACSAT